MLRAKACVIVEDCPATIFGPLFKRLMRAVLKVQSQILRAGVALKFQTLDGIVIDRHVRLASLGYLLILPFLDVTEIQANPLLIGRIRQAHRSKHKELGILFYEIP